MKALLQKTESLARAYNGSVKELCEQSGVEVRWFQLFRKGQINDPGVKKVQQLHDYLVKAKKAA